MTYESPQTPSKPNDPPAEGGEDEPKSMTGQRCNQGAQPLQLSGVCAEHQ